MSEDNPPAGFTPLASKSRFISDMALVMHERLVSPHERVLRVLTNERQGNSEGFLHGGFILALADFALSYGTFAPDDRPPSITLNVNVNFLRAARPGQWLEIRIDTRKQSGSLLFADGLISAEGRIIAQASGVFRPVRPQTD